MHNKKIYKMTSWRSNVLPFSMMIWSYEVKFWKFFINNSIKYAIFYNNCVISCECEYVEYTYRIYIEEKSPMHGMGEIWKKTEYTFSDNLGKFHEKRKLWNLISSYSSLEMS